MAKSLNKVTLIGNLTKDPELRFTGTGTAVATFTVATNESWTGADGQKSEATMFHNIVAWRKLAEVCGEYLKKGSKVYVEGKVTYRSYENKEGVKKYVTEIVIHDLLMLDGKRSEDASAYAAEANATAAKNDDGLPF